MTMKNDFKSESIRMLFIHFLNLVEFYNHHLFVNLFVYVNNIHYPT